MFSKKVLAGLGFLFVLASLASASAGEQPTVVGTIVEVSPDTGGILLQVGVAEGQPVLRRFRLSESARIRMDGGFGRLADVVVGQTARIGYLRADGANIAETVEITSGPPAGSSVSSNVAREATGIEERRRYVDEVRRTLDVLEGSIEALSAHPDIENTTELARRGAIVDDLEARLETARSDVSSLSTTASQEAWTAGVDRTSAALAELSAALSRGWSVVANR